MKTRRSRSEQAIRRKLINSPEHNDDRAIAQSLRQFKFNLEMERSLLMFDASVLIRFVEFFLWNWVEMCGFNWIRLEMELEMELEMVGVSWQSSVDSQIGKI